VINAAANSLCRDAGFEPRQARLCREITVIMVLVVAGMGIAMVPGPAVRALSDLASRTGELLLI
jgi:DNA-binding transcriptional LysR family regulator